MKGILSCSFIVLLVLGTIFTLISGRRHKLVQKRHPHRMLYRKQRLHDYEHEYSFLKKYDGSRNYKVYPYHVHPKYSNPKNFYNQYQYHKNKKHSFSLNHWRRLHKQGRGILSTLINTPIKALRSLYNLDPLQAIKDVVGGVSGTASEVVSKFGEFASGIQTQINNLAADEINDLVGAADQPINYQLFTPSNKVIPMIMNKTSSVNGTSWNKDQLTKVIIHGFSPEFKPTNTTLDLLGQLTIKDSYFAAGKMYNIIVADWTSLARTYNYLSAAAATRIAGADLSTFLHNLFKDGHLRSVEDVHIIGFSLGAHVSGVAGRLVEELLDDGVKIGRITGLDPAELNFGELDGEVPHDARFVLDKTDAKFVDVVHCNTGSVAPIHVGLRAKSGHADFYPNGGSDQPGCGDSVGKYLAGCSHSRCWQLYSESVDSNKYVACKCESWEDFQSEKCGCDSQDKVYMGDTCNTKARGKFYLKANIDRTYAVDPDQQPQNQPTTEKARNGDQSPPQPDNQSATAKNAGLPPDLDHNLEPPKNEPTTEDPGYVDQSSPQPENESAVENQGYNADSDQKLQPPEPGSVNLPEHEPAVENPGSAAEPEQKLEPPKNESTTEDPGYVDQSSPQPENESAVENPVYNADSDQKLQPPEPGSVNLPEHEPAVENPGSAAEIDKKLTLPEEEPTTEDPGYADQSLPHPENEPAVENPGYTDDPDQKLPLPENEPTTEDPGYADQRTPQLENEPAVENLGDTVEPDKRLPPPETGSVSLPEHEHVIGTPGYAANPDQKIPPPEKETTTEDPGYADQSSPQPDNETAVENPGYAAGTDKKLPTPENSGYAPDHDQNLQHPEDEPITEVPGWFAYQLTELMNKSNHSQLKIKTKSRRTRTI